MSNNPEMSIKDLEYDVFSKILNKVSPQSAVNMGIAYPPLYQFYKREFRKLKEYYENVPTPTEVDAILREFVATVDRVDMSFSMVVSEDDMMMEDDFMAPTLRIITDSLLITMRSYELGETDPRSLEMRVMQKTEGTQFRLFSRLTTYKNRRPVAYNLCIIDGPDARYDAKLLTIATMLPHVLGAFYQKIPNSSIQQRQRPMSDRAIQRTIERIASMYPKNIKDLRVQPPAVMNRSSYSLSKNVKRRTSPMSNW